MALERLIPVTGESIKPFWAASTTAPADPAYVTTAAHTDAGPEDDGLVHLTSQVAAEHPVAFETTLRTAYDAVPLVARKRGFSWQSCFSAVFDVDLRHPTAFAALDVIRARSTDRLVTLTIQPGSAHLVLAGAETDVWPKIAGAVLSSTATELELGIAGIQVLAKRTGSYVIGNRSTFELAVVFHYNDDTVLLSKAEKTIAFSDMYRAEFRCGVLTP
jgi:hypothetical protein